MPVFHPDPPYVPPTLASEGRVLAALRTLPPEAHILVRLSLLDPQDNHEKELDFVVLHPELGIVLIETKGKGVLPAGDHWVRHTPDGRTERLHEDPAAQLTAQQWFLLGWLRNRVPGFIPQITRVLALPFLPGPSPDLGPDLPACRVLDEAKLKSPFLALREAVAGGDWRGFQASRHAQHHHLAPERRDALLAALTPKCLPPPSLAELLAEEASTQDLEGERLLDHLARNFAQGRYRVQGAPGSGKSWLGRKVARLWAAQGRRVLVVAFNRALTYATQVALDDLIREQGAVVSTFHDLAASHLEGLGALPSSAADPDTLQQFFNVDLPRAFGQALPRVAARWDALVVDEAQDLEPAWVETLRGLLRDPERDPILLLEDPAQSLYRAGRHTLGHPWRLDLSLRQAADLRNAAVRAFPGCGWPELPPEAGARACESLPSSPRRWREDLAEVLADLAEGGLSPAQVLVLFPHRPASLGLADGQRIGPWPVNLEPDWWEGEKSDHVRLGTVHAFKGLEADVVVYLAPAHDHPQSERLRYTALSRARHRVRILEAAIPKPVPKSAAPIPAPPKPMPARTQPSLPRPACELGNANRLAVLSALRKAAQGPHRKPTEGPAEPEATPESSPDAPFQEA